MPPWNRWEPARRAGAVAVVAIAALLSSVVLAGLGCARVPPPLVQLDEPDRALRLDGDRRAVQLYREGLRSVVAYAAARPDLFPPEGVRRGRLLSPEDRADVVRTWGRFLDYVLALDAIGRSYEGFGRLDGATREPALLLTQAAFLAEYRFALDLLDLLDRDPGLEPLLNEPVPEVGLPRGSYARIRLRFLNLARASEFVALGVLAERVDPGQAPELAAGIREDRARLWEMGRGRGEALTAKNAGRVVQQAGFAAWFPVQAGVAEWMSSTKVWRPGRALITPAQIRALAARLEPGDILLVRREWYLSNIGIPGFWPHTALYVGTPAARRRVFATPDAQAWVRAQGPADGELEALLGARYPDAYARHIRRDGGADRPVLEALGEGVTFSPLEHTAEADSLAVLRPRLSPADKAAALVRGFHYAGRPYDFDFDFRTDAALVCSELIYKAYEPGAGRRGLRLPLRSVLDRLVLPPNELARLVNQEADSAAPQLDVVLFLDGHERAGATVEASLAAFRGSWQRPKWHIVQQP